MHMKFISFITGAAIILAGCGSQNYFPLTGAPMAAEDPVRLMAAPNLLRY